MTLYLQMIRDGGPIMLVIAFCTLIAVFIFLKKYMQFYRAQVNVDDLIKGLVNVLRRDGMIEAITLCETTPGPVARVLSAAIHAYQNGDDIKQALEDQSLIEVPRLESHMNILATLTYIMPLLGLLGTVAGMMETFRIMQQSSAVTMPELSKGVHLALVCTAAGLCVAIPCHIAYNFLLTKIQGFCVEMERASSSIMTFFQQHDQETAQNEK